VRARKEVLLPGMRSVSVRISRGAKNVFSATSRLLSRTGLTVRQHPLSNYITRTSSVHFIRWYLSARRFLRTQCTVILDISPNAYCLKVGPCEGSNETNCLVHALFQSRRYIVICKGTRQLQHFRRRSHECHVRMVRV
jgi:hypothetical protein